MLSVVFKTLGRSLNSYEQKAIGSDNFFNCFNLFSCTSTLFSPVCVLCVVCCVLCVVCCVLCVDWTHLSNTQFEFISIPILQVLSPTNHSRWSLLGQVLLSNAVWLLMERFHNLGYVHGDIRSSNTMKIDMHLSCVCLRTHKWHKSTFFWKATSAKYMLIDFDWSGWVGD